MHLCKPCFHLRLTSRACLPLSIAVLKSPTNLGRASPGSTGAPYVGFRCHSWSLMAETWVSPPCASRHPLLHVSHFLAAWFAHDTPKRAASLRAPRRLPRRGVLLLGRGTKRTPVVLPFRRSFSFVRSFVLSFVLSFINSLMQRFICGKRGGSLVSASRISAAKLAAAVARLAARRPRAALRRLQPRPSCLALARVSGAARSVLVHEGKSVRAVAAPPGPSFPLCNSYLSLLRCRRRQDPRLCGCMNFAAGGLQPRSGRRWKARGPARRLVQVWGRCTAPLPR